MDGEWVSGSLYTNSNGLGPQETRFHWFFQIGLGLDTALTVTQPSGRDGAKHNQINELVGISGSRRAAAKCAVQTPPTGILLALLRPSDAKQRAYAKSGV